MSDYEQLRLKRIFAQGAAAAGRLTREQRRIGEVEGYASLNPYAEEPGRSRWTQGFDCVHNNGGKPPPKPKTFGRRGKI
jgi:hypothetical protein